MTDHQRQLSQALADALASGDTVRCEEINARLKTEVRRSEWARQNGHLPPSRRRCGGCGHMRTGFAFGFGKFKTCLECRNRNKSILCQHVDCPRKARKHLRFCKLHRARFEVAA